MKRTLATRIGAGTAAACLAAAISISAASAAGPAAMSRSGCQRAALHVRANGRESLSGWLAANDETFDAVLRYSITCGGGFLSKWFGRYVDRQDNRLIMRKGTRFWAEWPQ